jgi:hypothetical protein
MMHISFLSFRFGPQALWIDNIYFIITFYFTDENSLLGKKLTSSRWAIGISLSGRSSK